MEMVQGLMMRDTAPAGKFVGPRDRLRRLTKEHCEVVRNRIVSLRLCDHFCRHAHSQDILRPSLANNSMIPEIYCRV